MEKQSFMVVSWMQLASGRVDTDTDTDTDTGNIGDLAYWRLIEMCPARPSGISDTR